MRSPSLFSLEQQSALVTGGGRGIGRHIAFGLAEAGAHVFLASRKAEPCAETAEAITAQGGQATALSADISQPEAWGRLVDEVLERTPRLHILVNNAGRTWAAPFFDYPLEAWDKVFDLNVRGLFGLSQRVAQHMREAGGGAILHVSSITAFRASRDENEPVVAYNASKGAVTALTADMAVKLAPHGIRVNAIAPGLIKTDFAKALWTDPERLERVSSALPMRRIGEPDEIGELVLFMCSDACTFMTADTVYVNGGGGWR